MMWSNSIFLQALGWATLNSFWQMALLWCFYLLANHFFKISSVYKYWFAVLNITIGFFAFIISFLLFYINGATSVSIFNYSIDANQNIFSVLLSSASVTYLLLLIIPAYKVAQSWQFLQKAKKNDLEKAPVQQRLFVQKIAKHIGIKKNVLVHLSQWVTSPVTIGYFKPIILIPVSALTNLTPQQLEAVLLHELSHIKRHDYLINLLLTAMHVVLYFNPFVKFFINIIEEERENCCDELVLQFDYDKISYASALLQLEKTNHQTSALAMAATNKNYLLHRIEKIVGMQKKDKFNATHFFGAFASLIFFLSIHSVMISQKQTIPAQNPFNFISQPYSFFTNQKPEEIKDLYTKPEISEQQNWLVKADPVENNLKISIEDNYIIETPPDATTFNPHFKMVAKDEVEASLTEEENEYVKATIHNTKKALQANWSEVEKSIADGLNAEEKLAARAEYLNEIEKLDWKRMEQNLKATYDQIDWEKVNVQLHAQMAVAQLDSLKTTFLAALTQLEKRDSDTTSTFAPLPDVSVTELNKLKLQLQLKIKEINDLKSGKTIKL